MANETHMPMMFYFRLRFFFFLSPAFFFLPFILRRLIFSKLPLTRSFCVIFLSCLVSINVPPFAKRRGA